MNASSSISFEPFLIFFTCVIYLWRKDYAVRKIYYIWPMSRAKWQNEWRSRFDTNVLIVNAQFAYFDYPADSRQVFFINPVSRDWHRMVCFATTRNSRFQRSANAFAGLSSSCFFLFLVSFFFAHCRTAACNKSPELRIVTKFAPFDSRI